MATFVLPPEPNSFVNAAANQRLRPAASHLDLLPVDSDEGQILASRRPLSISHPE
jgi:hypothetical protein